MASPKDILVITTSATDGLKVKKHLKPVSAHVVAGTNLFSDFLGGLSDVFGGRSDSYQKQLTSLYNEAIDKIKYNAHEIGANCVIGLNIDMDEISGKGKSMFMLTAIGTAVVIEKDEKPKSSLAINEKFENVGVERIDDLRQRKDIIAKSQNGTLEYNNEIWSVIITNHIEEIFPFIIKKHTDIIVKFQIMEYDYNIFNKNFISYIDSLDENKKISLLFDKIENEQNEQVTLYLSKVIKELNLFEFERVLKLLNNSDFNKQKIGLRICMYDKPFYNKQDINEIKTIINFITNNFKERGIRSIKKQILSTEKEVWTCDCGTINYINDVCNNCYVDISGFKRKELKPDEVVEYLEQKIELINEYLA